MHPLGNLASRDVSVRIGLLTLVSVMVNLRDNLKSVWCASSRIYRIMAHFAAQIEVLSNGEAEREKITNYDEVQTTWPTVPTSKL